MSAATDAAPAVERVPGLVPRLVAGSLFAAVVVAIAAVAAWPICRSWNLPVLVIVAATVAAGIAFFAWRRRWRAWTVAAVLAGAFVVLGLPLAVPSRLGGPSDLLRGLGELTSGVVFAWKDLVTVELPVGAYRNLLVPALVVFLVGTCLLLLLAWRDDSGAYAAVPVALAMVSFGLFFGRTSVSAPLPVGPVALYAPVETVLGVATLLSSLLWLAWRTHDQRLRALQRAAVSSGVRVSRRPTRADRRRTVLGAAMVAGALVVAVGVVPFAARGAERQVLRTAVGPEIDLSAAVSPLAQYRALFSDDRANDVLFTVSSGAQLPERVRLATLDAYDGEVFRSGGEGAVDAGRFVRVPSGLDAGAGEPLEAEIRIEGLDGIWMPTAGRLSSVEFGGGRAASLADRFYYNQAAEAGVQTAGGGLQAGDRYVVRGVDPLTPELSEAVAPGGVDGDVAAPDSLRAWVEEHAVGSGGAALDGLVSLLRERGYLSHALSRGEEQEPVWMQSLADYTFQPSASGHSLARIEAMFSRLLERETDARAKASGNFVAAVGDDEQFAVAVALIARELGFPSRVVLGARLATDDPALAVCDEGACRAQDLTAWTEIQTSGGAWVPVDVTPQFTQSPSLDVTEQRDPEVVTEVRPDTVEEVIPPDPVQEDSGTRDPGADDAGLDPAWLLPVLRVTAITLLVLTLALGPFLIVLGAKAARRRGRRRAESPAAAIAGGWEEFVDAAVDAGHDAPRNSTRSELAASFGSEPGRDLAVVADRAVFSTGEESAAEADEFWRSVDEQRRAFARERGFWRRLVAAVSLRSFVRSVAPVSGAATRLAERGKRRAPEPVRPMP